MQSPVLCTVLDRAADIMPPDWYLGAGCIAQSVWNHMCYKDRLYGINDLDLVYFDAADLGEDAEDDLFRRARDEFGDIPVPIDVKNEARVHLWYEKHFGYPIAPYASLEDAINSWPTTATSIGLRKSSDGLLVYAPYGLNDLFAMIVRPNKRQITRELYEAKANRWRECWPDLTIVPW